ncbi:TraR/DksA C4-type zinc finger protein [Candidatus Parcubacteria bacterium]|nr:TraR/DksA C4-type zinc finger protein [Candidatus Parcubacteria bacterium]
MDQKPDQRALKEKLEKERTLVESELKAVGRKNPEIKGDWEATAPELNNSLADKNDVADRMEEFEGNFATEGELEARLKDITDALARMEGGTYGICETGGERIEAARLNANPAARTCIAHR